MKLQNRIALVTGASRGIGAAIARRLASDGAAVAAVYNAKLSAAEEVAGIIRSAGGHAAIFQADVSDERPVNAMVKEVVAQFGRIEIVVNTGGVFEAAPVGQITRELFHNEVFTHAWSVVAITQAVVPYFPASGGAIVNVSTNLVHEPGNGTAVYSAAKATVEVLTRGFAMELGRVAFGSTRSPRRLRVPT
jgi:3-oxoacyl-[acyl-carrier protein] reductase